MKRIPIILILLFGLMTPFSVQAAEFGEALSDADAGVLEAASKDIESSINAAEEDALASLKSVDKTEGAEVDAVKKMFNSEKAQLEKLGENFKGLSREQAAGVLKSFKESVEESATKIDDIVKNSADDASVIAGKIGKLSEDTTANFKTSLDDSGLSPEKIEEITTSMDKAVEESDSIIASGKPKVTLEKPKTQAEELKSATNNLEEDVNNISKKLDVKGEAQVKSIEQTSGTENNSFSAQKNEDPSFLDQYKARDAEEVRLNKKIHETADNLSKLKKDTENTKLKVEGEPPTSVTLEGKAFKQVNRTPEQVKAFEKALEGKEEITIDSDKVTFSKLKTKTSKIYSDKEIITVKVKVGNQELEFEIEPTNVEKELLKDPKKCTFSIGKDGKLSVKSTDGDLVTQCSSTIKDQAESIKSLEEELTSLKKAHSDSRYFFEQFHRIGDAGRYMGKGLKMLRDNPKEVVNIVGKGAWKGIKFTGKKLYSLGKKIVGGIAKVGEMMMTGVFFGVPSMIFQTLQQQAAARALYEQITSVVTIAPGFAVQIPAGLISEANASSASTYLYVAVDPSSSGYGNHMSSSFLENASYYAVYQSGVQWGSTYSGAPNSSSGIWINLNTGLIFTENGIPNSEQTPFTFLMEPTNDSNYSAAKGQQGTLSVQQYTQQAFSSVGSHANYSFSASYEDAVAPWRMSTESADHAVNPNPTLQAMFASVSSSSTSGKEKIQKSTSYAPKLLVKTLNIFRNGIQNVPGFLPGKSSPKISIRQFQGTEILNRLLGSQSSSDNITQSIKLITALSSIKSSQSSTNVIQAVIDAQAGLKQALMDGSSSNYGKDLVAASATLKKTRTDLRGAIAANGGGATLIGFNSSLDVNAYNIYLYETEDTPIVTFMKESRFSDLIPAKDYLVFLDINSNIVPLFSTALITRPDGVGVIDFDTSQVNSNIQYMASLVTGITYLYSTNGPGEVMPSINNVTSAAFISGTVMPALFNQIALVLDSSDALNLTNQILSMANYATNLSYQGPIVKNGCLLERVSLALSAADKAASNKITLNNAFNGITIPVKSSKVQISFGASATVPQTQLDSTYIYKVSKIVQGSKQTVGVFGDKVSKIVQGSKQTVGVLEDNKPGPIYDYVVPVASTTNADGTPALQMMPLGIASAAGIDSGMSGVQFMVSLVTGQVYDNNYCLMANATATVIERDTDFNTILAQPGQDSIGLTNADGSTTSIAVVKGLPLSTAFMPTFCNPYNITYGSLYKNTDYKKDVAESNSHQAAVTSAQAAVTSSQATVTSAQAVVNSDIKKAEFPDYAQWAWNGLQKDQSPKVLAEIFAKYLPKLGLTGEPAGTFEADIQDWITAKATLTSAQATLTSAQTTLTYAQQSFRLKVLALQSVLQPPYYDVKKALPQMVIMCPMYWMHYLKYAWATQAAAAQTVSYTNASSAQLTASINWINTSVSTSTTPLGYSLAQSIPITNCIEIVNAYQGWQEVMNSKNGIAKVMQSGPFQFSKNQQYNVFLTLPPSNGPLNLETGNFFYNMVPVASPTSLFVLGNLDSGIASTVATSLNSSSTSGSGLTAPLTIDQCNTGDLLGKSYLEMLTLNPIAIDISTGDVWLPTPTSYSLTCAKTAQGNIANAQCNVFKIGTLDAEAVLKLALKNQGSSMAKIQIDNPGLYSTLMNCQALSIQKNILALTSYFAGSLLSLCQEQITNGTYIYAVNVQPEDYYTATDYWVATDSYGTAQGILTPQTQYMISLVTANVYQMNLSSNQQTAQSTMQTIAVGTGVATIDTPLTGFQQIFGISPYPSTMLTPVASNNPTLFNIIESLNNLQNQDFLQSQFASSASTTILAGQIPLDLLQTATPVSALYSTLYLVNGKYYLAMPGIAGAPTYYYDFNAEMQDVNSSSGTPVYTPIPGDAKRGMYYMVEGTGSTAVATPTSELTGYGCQSMRMRFGIAVDASGNETIGLPVYNPPLPMTANDVMLLPGASGDNMKCLTSAANIASNASVTDSYTYYQYKNSACESYFSRCVLNTNIPVYNQATKAVISLPENKDYYVDLVTGECYSPDGTPQLSQITVAYDFVGTATTGIVLNSALDFSNPLFVWGELDMLGESLQAYMMYQDTNADDSSSYGYNQYQVQQYSTSFTLYNGNTPTVYAYEVDASGNVQITQNGNAMSPAQTSMSSALVTALNSGSLLTTKSYTMNINGVVPSGTPVAGATVTVTETFVTPKQYMISYTDTDGTLIMDMFQTPVTSGTGTAPGASTNSYNKPPLDAPLQAQLLQGKPFCARVFASCPYGKETVQNINTTIASATSAAKELALGTTGVTCGLLYQPVTATSFTLPSAGLLSAIFSGANPAGSTGAMNGQYFAFYDCYNNGTTSTGVVPNKGQYGTYISVVASMSNNFTTPYPGLYAGNFNVEFTSSNTSTAVATTYGAPYLRIMPLAGSIPDTSTSTSYAVPPTPGTEYLYKYQYDTVPNATLAKLKSTLNISGNTRGFMQLVSALDAGDLAGVSVSNASVNEAVAAVISNQVFYGTPLNALTQEPKGRYVYKLQCASGGADASSTAATNELCQMFYTAGATNPDTYIDLYNGIVFQSKTTADNKQLLYPIGFSITNDQSSSLGKMVGGAIPAQGSNSLTITTPFITTNSKGNLVGTGAALPGQIVKGVIVAAPSAIPAT